MVYRLIICCFVLLSVVACSDESDNVVTKKKLAEMFLSESGLLNLVDKSVTTSMDYWKQAKPNIPASFWDNELSGDISRYRDRMRNAQIDAYAEQFSSDELKKLIEFYRTPAGKKLAAMSEQVMPALQIKSQDAAVQFEKDINSTLSKHGYSS